MSLQLLKSLGVNTRGLVGYDKLYGTTPHTFGYRNSSMWAYCFNPITETIEVHTTYFKETEAIKKYNEAKWKEHYTGRLKELDWSKLSEWERKAWESIKEMYQL